MIQFDSFKARCSQLSLVCSESSHSKQLTEIQKLKLNELLSKDALTEKQKTELAELELKNKKSEVIVLSDSYIGYLMDEYAFITEGMVGILNDFEGLQMINGTLVEAESLITLIQAEQKHYQPNITEGGIQERVFNEYLSGCPDAYFGESLMTAEEIPDIKSSFDYPTFLKKINTPLSKANRMQVQGYLDITNAKIGFISDCLSNTHDKVKDRLKWNLLKKLEEVAVTEESPAFKEQWTIIERSTNFDHMSPKLKVHKRYVEIFTPTEQQFIYDQVKRGRDFLNKLYEERLKLC